MLSFASQYPRHVVAALAGALTVPAGLPARASEPRPSPAAETAPAAPAARALPGTECLASTVCNLKNRVRWRTPAWKPEFCLQVSEAVRTSAKRYDVSPALVLAVMLNESDLDENAVRLTERNGEIYAKDTGLMGIRCVLDKQQRCTNGNVRGLPWKTVMDPLTNIELGARELSKWRKAGVARVTVRVRDGRGGLLTKEKYVTCQHKTHAYWAHYNHGPLYIDTGPARHYPHRIAVLYYELARTLGMDAPELREQRITIRDPGVRERTPDRPVEVRYRKLCEQIRSVGGFCSGVASLTPPQGLN